MKYKHYARNPGIPNGWKCAACATWNWRGDSTENAKECIFCKAPRIIHKQQKLL